eukprot:CAMPEP_0201607850 /NCGR_PEP_ID=MMETSP0492-20130828/6825_1 /ASSEMBLY_ACC=CAM_ASM_000837 /TAXON_ID=420259 /ORGANISM="Thalassiosira gravida, Strain GMp14c1" /LENGTH=349 /DNA_ID=CAMNT_0048072525 /DNA_START=286 /DNA_END=1332 /DNA_ORIENTATION=-
MTACPTVVDRTNEAELEAAQLCMEQGRSVKDMDAYMIDFSSFDEEIIFVDRPKGSDPIRVLLLKKQNTPSNDKSPLVFYIHGGGFTVRGSKDSLAAQMLTALLKMDTDDSPVMEGATWAIVEYGLAPEYVYPSAPKDCVLALNHLVHKMGLGGGGIHVAGVSAGGTLAMETTLKSMVMVDSFYVDEPVVPMRTNNNDGKKEWSMDTPSFRRYSYARMPPVTWLEWSLKAYTGIETDRNVEKDLLVGTAPTSVDITGGSMTVSEWVKRSKSTPLPPLILVTAKGDPLQYGGLAFKGVYEQAIGEVAEKTRKGNSSMDGEISKIRHFDTNAGHVGFYAMEPAVFQEVMKEW